MNIYVQLLVAAAIIVPAFIFAARQWSNIHAQRASRRLQILVATECENILTTEANLVVRRRAERLLTFALNDAMLMDFGRRLHQISEVFGSDKRSGQFAPERSSLDLALRYTSLAVLLYHPFCGWIVRRDLETLISAIREHKKLAPTKAPETTDAPAKVVEKAEKVSHAIENELLCMPA